MRIRLPGDIHYALSHFALYGAAAIIEQELGARVRLRWLGADASEIRLVTTEWAEPDVANALLAHAKRHTGTWVQAVHEHRTGKKTSAVGTLSPRLPQAADQESWQALQEARHFLMDEALKERQWLDLAFMQALGEPSYWYRDQNGKPRPDTGASGWEMKTRNRGEEFIKNRLAPLAQSVSKRPPEKVLQGLTGEYFADEEGKNAPDSRTPTGLRPPYPTDNAVAWAALWGISFFPVLHRATILGRHKNRQGATSLTTGQLRTGMPGLNRFRRAYTILPRIDRPMGLATLKSVLVSGPLARQAAARIKGGATNPDPRTPADIAWLRSKGVGGLLTSVVTASDNPNAPELAVARGELVTLPL